MALADVPAWRKIHRQSCKRCWALTPARVNPRCDLGYRIMRVSEEPSTYIPLEPCEKPVRKLDYVALMKLKQAALDAAGDA